LRSNKAFCSRELSMHRPTDGVFIAHQRKWLSPASSWQGWSRLAPPTAKQSPFQLE
jgi:hypothetical protein